MYEEIRRAMAGKYASENYFGPVETTSPIKPIREMTSEEYSEYKKKYETEAAMVKMGYKRIKEKVKNIRQDYSKAVMSGTRSGSGKIVFAHYDALSTIWGGSPSAEALPYGVDSQSAMTSVNYGTDGTDEVEPNIIVINEDGDAPLSMEGVSSKCSTPRAIDPDQEEKESEAADDIMAIPKVTQSGKTNKRKAADIPRLIDNKRKHLEKKLTSAQRDQKLLEAAKEDACVRREMMDCFKESAANTAKAIECMSETMKGLSDGILQGMTLLANAIATPQNNTHVPQMPPTVSPAQPNYYHQSGTQLFQPAGYYQPIPASVVPHLSSRHHHRASANQVLNVSDKVDEDNSYFPM